MLNSTCLFSASLHPTRVFYELLNDKFKTDENYHRAYVRTLVMALLRHLDSDFENVVAIEAANEHKIDVAATPNYGNCEFPVILTIHSFLT